jgi:FMN phosphatase YigB (HAD superfamily)
MIKLIIFDNEGVLVNQHRNRVFHSVRRNLRITRKQVKDVIKRNNIDVNFLDSIGVKFYKTLKFLGSTSYNIGKVDKKTFWMGVLKEYELALNDENVTELSLAMESLVGNAFHDVVNYVKELKKQKFRVVMLSNTLPEIMSATNKKYDLSIFNHCYLSYEIGYRKDKHNTKAFEYVLRKENIKPSEAIFIDDKDVNVKVSQHIGIHGVQYSGKQSVKLLKLKMNKIIDQNLTD